VPNNGTAEAATATQAVFLNLPAGIKLVTAVSKEANTAILVVPPGVSVQSDWFSSG
jgi:hypothetical protein